MRLSDILFFYYKADYERTKEYEKKKIKKRYYKFLEKN